MTDRMRRLRVLGVVAAFSLSTNLTAQPQRPMPVAMIRIDRNRDFVPDALGDVVEVSGVATTDARTARGTLQYVVLQDTSGAIRILAERSSGLLARVKRGESVRVTGRLQQDEGREELLALELDQLGHAPPPRPRPALVIDVMNEQYEDQLVLVSGQLSSHLTKQGERVFEFRDRSGVIPVRVPDRLLSADTSGLLARGGNLDLVAIAGQHDPSPPFDSGYRLAPRELADFEFAPVPPYRLIVLVGFLSLTTLLSLRFWLGRGVARRRAAEMERLSDGLRRSEEALRLRSEQLATIVDIQRDIATAPPYAYATMSRIARHAQELTRADGAVVGLLDGAEVEYRVGSGMCEPHVEWRAGLQGSATGHALRSLEIFRCDNALEDPRCDRTAAETVGCRALMVVPLIYGARAIGTLAIVSREAAAFRSDDEHALRLISSFLAAALSNALEFEAKQAVIVERTQALRALRESEQRFRSLIENASDPIAILDGGGRIRYASPAHERILGYTTRDLVGVHARELVHLADQARFQARLHELITDPARPVDLEFRFRHKSGEWRTLAATGRNLLHDPSVEGIVINARDVSERNLLELQLHQAQKMEAVGQLAGGVAHDFNNLITVIIGCAEWLLTPTDGADDPRGDLTEIKHAAERAASLTRQLLAFSRKQLYQAQRVNLNAVIANLEPMLRRLIGEDIRTTVQTDARLGAVMADPGQMDQVLMNLAVNARDAMPNGGHLMITTANVTLDAACGAAPGVHVPPGDFVRLTITDTGVGMSAETQARIFEPFFTTKAPGQGTGLGLSAVYGIVKQSSGFIWCSSEVGNGTTFELYLPCVAERAAPNEAESTSPYPPEGTESLLLVEDDESVRRLAGRVLRRHGYSVIEARDGREALELVATWDFDLVVTDIVMPEMNGRELAERLRARNPSIRVLYMSGYTDDEIIRRGLMDPSVAFLEKPFTAERLIDAVHGALHNENYLAASR